MKKLVIVFAHVLSLILFIHGFFLLRIRLDDVNIKRPGIDRNCTSCKAPYNKLVWLVVDALRYDFVVTDGRYECSSEAYCHQGHMNFLTRLIAHGNTNAMAAYRFISEPPTTTNQRLKSMTTGCLPTFFDISSSFNAAPISEDNIIGQLHRSGKKLAFVGDMTWASLFPTQWSHSSTPLPCYNVMDLHTVDDGIISRFQDLVFGNRTHEWDVLVAHYLGIDHAGHTHGVQSPAMATKLAQIDNHIEHVVKELISKQSRDENTLLLVSGDHGQTLGGDHGGGGPEEVDSLLIAIDIGTLGLELSQWNDTVEFEAMKPLPVMPQVDLVPTVSALLGVPIPFGSLGCIDVSLLHLGQQHLTDQNWTTRVVQDNAVQVHDYINAYAASGSFSSTKLKEINMLFAAISESSNPVRIIQHMTRVVEIVRGEWTQFNQTSMAAGLLLMSFTLLYHLRGQKLVLLRDALAWKDAVTIGGGLFCTLGIFSFFYLLTEGTMITFALIASACSLGASSYYRSAEKKWSIAWALLTLIACALGLLMLGISHHSGHAMWQKLHADPTMEPSQGVFTGLDMYVVFLSTLWSIPGIIASCTALAVISSQCTRRAELHVLPFLGFGLLTWYKLLSFDSYFVFFYSKSVLTLVIPRLIYSLCTLHVLAWLVLGQKRRTLGIVPVFLLLIPLLSESPWSPLLTVLAVGEAVSSYYLLALSGAAPMGAGAVLALLQSHLFFSSGHLCEFAGLRYTAAFVGLSDYHLLSGVILMSIDTFGGMAAVFLGGVASYQGKKNDITSATLFWRACLCLAAMVSAAVQQRHLYIWALLEAVLKVEGYDYKSVTAPRFVFEACFLVVTDILALCF